MEEETITTQEPAEKQPESQPVVETIDQLLTPEPEKPKENLIPEAVFLSEKKGRKEAEKKIKELEQIIANGDTSDISDTIDAIAEEFETDPKFVKKLADIIRKDVEKDVEARVADKLRPFEEKNKAEKFNEIFKTQLASSLERMPEYKDLINPEVIKALTLSPMNGNKTFDQIIEETYGHAITGKRTIESTTPAGGKEPEPFNFDKARKDPEYYKQVMSNPREKEKYNAELIKRLG